MAAFQDLNLRVVAAGDSYNDTAMLAQADAGVLYCPPANVVAEFPQFPVARDYDQLRDAFGHGVQSVAAELAGLLGRGHRLRVEAVAVVGDGDAGPGGQRLQRHGHLLRAGVLAHIGERLLHHAAEL